ncbi:hypothetical protein [Salinihabitans flavidus]|uniref:hypothetical protein n=1 Tax=Salinihabitans flavidus TaxID=569882 RepID=UPI0011143F33|nr:hypothetical protein [Salinihabitans flavidus]
MKIPKQNSTSEEHRTRQANWRELISSGADAMAVEGFALEHLIDLQRDRSARPENDGHNGDLN